MVRVLIIDDEKDVRDVLSRMLQRAGFEVAAASTGVEGIELYRADPVEVVIIDIIMPEKDGIDAIKDIRLEFPDAKIIAISGGGSMGPEYEPAAIKTSAYLGAAQRAGADRSFTKPFERKELIEAVQELVRERAG